MVLCLSGSVYNRICWWPCWPGGMQQTSGIRTTKQHYQLLYVDAWQEQVNDFLGWNQSFLNKNLVDEVANFMHGENLN